MAFGLWQWPHSPRLTADKLWMTEPGHIKSTHLPKLVHVATQPESDSNNQLRILDHWQNYRTLLTILYSSFSQGAQSNTGRGCASVLNTQLLSGTISSSLNSRYRYLSLIKSMNRVTKPWYEKLTSLPGKNWRALVKIKLRHSCTRHYLGISFLAVGLSRSTSDTLA